MGWSFQDRDNDGVQRNIYADAEPPPMSFGRGSAPTIYDNGGLPADVVQRGADTMRGQLADTRAPSRMATGAIGGAPYVNPNPAPAYGPTSGGSYTDNGPTDPDRNGRRANRPVDARDEVANIYNKMIGNPVQAALSSHPDYNSSNGADFRAAAAKPMQDPFAYRGAPTTQTAGAITAPAAVTKGGMPDKYTAPQAGGYTPGGDEVKGAAQRINPSASPAAQQGVRVVNYYNPDAAPTGNNPWQDMARQVANFSALRALGPQGPQASMIANPTDDTNALLDKWGKEYQQQQIMSLPPKQQQAALALAGLQNQHDIASMQHAATLAGQGITARGQDLGYASHMGGIGLQNQGAQQLETMRGGTARDVAGINAGSHLAGIGLQTQSQESIATGNNQAQRDVAGIHSRGQLDLESARENSPTAKAQARLWGSQAANFDAQTAAGKADPMLPIIGKLIESGMLDPRNPTHSALADRYVSMLQQHLGSGSPHAEGTQLRGKDGNVYVVRNGKPVPVNGYAGGGFIDKALTAVGLRKPEPKQPAPAPQQPPQDQQQQQQPQQPRGISVGDAANAIQNRGRQLRELDNYADGGAVDPNSMAGLAAKLRGMEQQGRDYTQRWNAGQVQTGPSAGASPYDINAYMSNRGQPSGGLYTGSDGVAHTGSLSAIGGWDSSNPVSGTEGLGVRTSVGGGYASGGPIDVSGRQVLGAGTGKSDSLPAVIDGEHPAALSTEEFVMPVETVRHFGLAKLNKMVAESRKGH